MASDREPKQEGGNCMTHGDHRIECAGVYSRVEKFVCLKITPLQKAIDAMPGIIKDCKDDVVDKLHLQRFFLGIMFVCIVGGGFWTNGNSATNAEQTAKIAAIEQDREKVIKRIDKLEERIDVQHEDLDRQYRSIMNEIRRLHKVDPILSNEE